jgi:hypothetical protein
MCQALLMVHANHSELIRTALDDLDEILGGLLAGDNVVWVSNEPALCAHIEQLMLSAAPASEKAIYVSAQTAEDATRRTFGEDVIAVAAHPGSRFSEPILLEQTIYTAAKQGARASRVVIDGLASFAQQWGTARAIAFFKRLCPRLFDLGAIAYWRVPRAAVGNAGHRGDPQGYAMRFRAG